jgi:hypothetical protein
MKLIVKNDNKKNKAPCEGANKDTIKVKRIVLTNAGRTREEVEVDKDVWSIEAKFITELYNLAKNEGSFIFSVSEEYENQAEITFMNI